MKKNFLGFGSGLCLLLIALASGMSVLPADSANTVQDDEDRVEARRGNDLLMDGDPDAAIQVFRNVQANDPNSPLGYLLEADATWWKIYFQTGNLTDSDVFDVATSRVSPYDSHFEDLLATTARRAEVNIRAQQNVPRNVFYKGMAYALEARLTGLRGKDLACTGAAKKMRTLMAQVLNLDPNFTDAYLGLGTYNYYLDTLSAALKVLKIIVALPGGNRHLGLQQLELAADRGDLTRGTAQFYLAKTYSRDNERQFGKSLQISEALARDFPHNPLWPLLEAGARCRLRQSAEGDALYREVFEKTAGKNSVAELAVHRAALAALTRRHPHETCGE